FERRFRGLAAGLAPLAAVEDTLAIFSAAPGKLEYDSDGSNSLFVGELLNQIRSPGVTAEQAFIQTRTNVSTVSNGKQAPWIFSSLVDQFRLAPTAESQGSRTQSMPPAPNRRDAVQGEGTSQPGRTAVINPSASGAQAAGNGNPSGQVLRDCPT